VSETPPGGPVEPSIDRSGIHLPREVADAEGVPEELDANVFGEYRFPSPERRRTGGWLYLAGAVLLALGAVAGLGVGLAVVAGAMGVLAAWHFLAAWPLRVDEQVALRTAVAEVGFPVGHASAAVRFSGWRARPVWFVVIYDAGEPPRQRALVRVDGVDGTLGGAAWVESIDAGPA
jgi:hypothetical protein